MKKVLFVATVTMHINAFHIPYLKMLKENGYEVHVASNGDEKIEYCDKHYNIPFERSPLKPSNIKAYKELKKVLNDNNYDIVHCHTPVGGVLTRLAAKGTRKKETRVIYTAHGFHFYKGAPLLNWMIFYPIEWYLSKCTDTLITINKEDYERAKNKFSKRCKDIEYVPGVGADENKFNFEMTEKEKNEYREILGLTKDDFILTCVGRLDKNKNQIFLINCMEQLVKEDKNIHLLLAGQDELNGYYQNETSKRGLDRNIHFLGQRNDIPKLLKISNVYVSSSKREGLPVSVIEAICCELPIIVSNCRGNRDLINDKINGFSINLNNYIEFINSILEIKDNKYSYNNKEIIKEYLLCNILSKMKKIYFKRKRVLHILASTNYSGAENVACTIIKNTSDEYETLYCSPKGKIETQLKQKNINYRLINKLSIKEIKKVIREFNPDIIHAHDNRASVIASLAGKKLKIVSHIHGNNRIMTTFNFKSYFYNILSKRICKIIWVSDSSLNDYYFKKNVISKSLLLYNIVDKDEIIKKSNEYKCDKQYDLMYLGRLAYPKNPERLIEIVRLLKQKKNDISLAIVGDGIEKTKIEELIYRYNLIDNIKMYGFLNNPYPILKNSKVLVMTSIYEGTPMVALEAQALEKPIVATPVDGLKRIVKNGYNGYLSNKNEEITNYIISLINNEQMLKQITNNSNMTSEEFNNISKYIRKIENIYES